MLKQLQSNTLGGVGASYSAQKEGGQSCSFDMSLLSPYATDEEHYDYVNSMDEPSTSCKMISISTYSKGYGDPKAEDSLEVAKNLVLDVMKLAQVKARSKQIADDPSVQGMVNTFVAEILEIAKREALVRTSKNSIQENNSAPEPPRQGRPMFAANPWMNRAARYMGSILDRICPCRTLFKV